MSFNKNLKIVDVIFNDVIKGSAGHQVFLLVEIRLADHQVAVVDPLNILPVIEKHGMLLNDFRSFFNGPVHLRINGDRLFLCTVIEDRQNERIIILNGPVKFGLSFLNALFSVPVCIIMRRKVVIQPSRHGVLFGTAGDK